jgi:hypothetical protein
MPITEPEWTSIASLVERMVPQLTGGRRNFKTGRVIKRDTNKKLVWLREFGDQPIPVVGFDYEVKYYDTDSTGNTVPKKAKISPVTPDVGEHVFVALEMGEHGLPRCLGTIQGVGWILPEDESGDLI